MIKTIFWDFDGVIIDSLTVRINAFRNSLKDYPKKDVEKFIKYHLKNGGLSRYHKFEYFFNVIRQEVISEKIINELLKDYSHFCLTYLGEKRQLISSNLNYLIKFKEDYSMFLVSASDQNELRILAERLEIATIFKEVLGSPRTKISNIAYLLTKYALKPEESVLIGDSINDFDAAEANSIYFIGFSNNSIISKSTLPPEKIDFSL